MKFKKYIEECDGTGAGTSTPDIAKVPMGTKKKKKKKKHLDKENVI